MNELHELRKRLLYYGIVLITAVLLLWSISQQLYRLFSQPLLHQLPVGHHFIATSVTAPFLVPLKLAFMAGFLLTLPFLFYQLWAFIKPALYPNEKRMLWPFLLGATALFYTGAGFAYFITFPVVFRFLVHLTPQGVDLAPDISQYYDFAIQLILAFGFAFELPMGMWLLTRFGVMTPQQMAKLRPYVIVGAFVVGMLLTPPDILSQIFLAVPLCGLFELGLIVSKLR